MDITIQEKINYLKETNIIMRQMLDDITSKGLIDNNIFSIMKKREKYLSEINSILESDKDLLKDHMNVRSYSFDQGGFIYSMCYKILTEGSLIERNSIIKDLIQNSIDI